MSSEVTLLGNKEGGGLKVIGLGLGRTGTGSLKTALEELGYKVLHMSEHPKNLDHFTKQWNVIYNKADEGSTTRIDWDKLYGDYNACMDYPSAMFPQELYSAYPNAKFILSVRDPAKWKKSTEETIHRPAVFPIRQLSMLMSPRSREIRKISDRIWDTFFRKDFRRNGEKVFVEHNELCKRVIPADQLLVYEVKQGWEPLCKFLGVPVPDKPFPHDHEGSAMAAQMDAWQQMLVRQFLKQYVLPGVGFVGLGLTLVLNRRRIGGVLQRLGKRG